jgi:hypothetical protein
MPSTIEPRRWVDARLAGPHGGELCKEDVGDRTKQDGIRPSEPVTQSDAAVKDAGQRPAPRSGAQRP